MNNIELRLPVTKRGIFLTSQYISLCHLQALSWLCEIRLRTASVRPICNLVRKSFENIKLPFLDKHSLFCKQCSVFLVFQSNFLTLTPGLFPYFRWLDFLLGCLNRYQKLVGGNWKDFLCWDHSLVFLCLRKTV